MKDGGPDFYNEPAFPVINAKGAPEDYPGMSLRDWFAGQVLQGILASGNFSRGFLSESDFFAATAYKIADAMLKERGK